MSVEAQADAYADIEGFLARHEQKELVRFVTVGSVDDGKSTLIGRLLHDTNMVYDDQLAAVTKASRAKGDGEIDFSLFTDGLKAEREQGITIDVAYRYFSTDTRKFIIADTPGHEEYTRNMATGASTADLAIILLDARLGILPQSKRHATIASLLGISQLVVAVNKMDLCGYDQEVFSTMKEAFSAFLTRLRFDGVTFVPVSAKKGDNVVSRSPAMPWYEGPDLLRLLESIPISRARDGQPFRFPVQTVLRPNLEYRAFAGTLARGVVRAGDEVVALPSGRTTRVVGVDTFEGSLSHAFAPMSVALRLADEVDLSRGDMIAPKGAAPTVANEVEATLVWLSERPFDPSRRLLMKHTSRWVPARVLEILGKLSLETLELEPAGGIEMNAIVRARIHVTRPIFCDPYVDCRSTGAFILVDALSNATIAAGMIQRAAKAGDLRTSGPVTSAERAERLGHRAALILVRGDTGLLERELFDRGIFALALTEASPALVERLLAAGVVVIAAGPDEALLASATKLGATALDLRDERGDLVGRVVTAIS